jgi:hypothetical protein
MSYSLDLVQLIIWPFDAVLWWMAFGVSLLAALVFGRDDTTLSFPGRLVFRTVGDFEQTALKGHRFELHTWDHLAGTAQGCWKDRLDACGNLTNFFPQCSGWSSTQNILFDKDGHRFADDYWTPNGTIVTWLPDKSKIITA